MSTEADPTPLLPQVDAREIWSILRARKRLFLGALALGEVAVFVAAFAPKPVYRASSLLLIEPRKPSLTNVQTVYDPIAAGLGQNDYYKTQFEILRSRRIVEPVAAALGVDERREFAGERDPIEAFRDTIVVEPVRDSRLVRVLVESPDKAFATRVANAVVDQFVSESQKRALGLSDTGLQQLRDMERSLRPKREAAERALQRFEETNDLYSRDDASSIALQELRVVSEELARTRAERARLSADASAIATVSTEDADLGPSRVVEELKLALARLEVERDELARQYKPGHPQLAFADARVARARERLETERRQLAATTTKQLLAVSGREKELEAVVARAQSVVADLERRGMQMKLLREEAETVAASHKNVASRIEEVELAILAGSNENNFFVVDRAREPLAPVRPRRALVGLLGSLLSAVASVALCLLIEHLDDSIKGKQDAEALLGYPLLGFVPRADADASVVAELLASERPRSATAESFRTVRAGLGFTLRPGEPRALVVTSAGMGDGKTFVSVNLALVFAQTGRRVLLVDADLRRPRIHGLFGLVEPEEGLSTTLTATDPTLEAVRRTKVPSLDVLPAGPLPPNPAELLGSESLRCFVESALTSYDWVIFDAPPVAPISDAALLLAHVPHALFVVRALSTVRSAASRAKELLARAPGRVVGMVLNTVDVPRGDARDNFGSYEYGYRSPVPVHPNGTSRNGAANPGNRFVEVLGES